MFMCQTLFISYRTLEYVRCGDTGFFGEDENGDLDWDFVPIMLCFTAYYLISDTIAYLLFDVGRELNRKVFNEFINLRGKNKDQKNYHSFSSENRMDFDHVLGFS